ncbi:hypothetical protein [Miltoncostaea oceani]|uniref:hypothetical protein n=1 Tax=Miltoncostaea oceani TaxID=2843216 RepID=UPI001C3D6393|nr:hypothetical protein [Miltoncostaea oceani]
MPIRDPAAIDTVLDLVLVFRGLEDRVAPHLGGRVRAVQSGCQALLASVAERGRLRSQIDDSGIAGDFGRMFEVHETAERLREAEAELSERLGAAITTLGEILESEAPDQAFRLYTELSESGLDPSGSLIAAAPALQEPREGDLL